MKIDQKAQSRRISGLYKDGQSVRSEVQDGFSGQLTTELKRQGESQWDLLFADVDRIGIQLVAEQSLEVAERYRQAVKRMVEQLVKQGFHVNSQSLMDRTGRRKLLLTVEEIDRRLLDLVRGLMGKQKESLHILQEIGEIKGLLISLRV